MKDIQAIVNQYDEVIWEKLRSEITSDDIYRVSALWLENSAWEVLMSQRGFMKKNNPAKWSAAAAGTVDAGESYDENIYKEVEEELWLSGYIFEKWEKMRVTWNHNYFCQWYHLKADIDAKDLVLEYPEVESSRWFSPEEIRNILEYSPEIFTGNFRSILTQKYQKTVN